MQKNGNILYLRNHQIDKALWDECVFSSQDGLIYGHSFYLDNMAPGWEALVAPDYNWVLPVVYRKKMGIKYLYQPAFTQQLGIFSKNDVEVPFQDIIDFLKQRFRFWEVQWHHFSRGLAVANTIHCKEATNFEIPLSQGYEKIASKYHKDLVKNLKRSVQFKLQYQATDDYPMLIKLYKVLYKSRIPHVKEGDYDHFEKVCLMALQKHMFKGRKVINEKGELLAGAIVLTDGKRLYNLINVNTNEGRIVEANHFLLDSIIREHAGLPMTFDFEGSDLPGVKTFYENFGPQNNPYNHIRFNKLPWYIKWFKK